MWIQETPRRIKFTNPFLSFTLVCPSAYDVGFTSSEIDRWLLISPDNDLEKPKPQFGILGDDVQEMVVDAAQHIISSMIGVLASLNDYRSVRDVTGEIV